MMTQAAGDGKSGFRSVKAAILKRIESGFWGPGAALPGEVALAGDFGVSRATVNRAMRELAEEGLIDRRRKAGSRVRPAPRREARFVIPVVRDEIAALGAEYRYALVGQYEAAAPAWLRARMGLAEGARVRHVRCLHSAGPAPFQFEDRWISIDALPEARWHSFGTAGPTEWLIAAVPFSEVEVSFLAVAAERETASALRVEEGEALFAAERTTWWQGTPITHVRLTFRPGYRMTTRY